MTTVNPVQTHNKTALTGVRLVDPIRDIEAILSLIEAGFGAELDPQGKKMLAQMKRTTRVNSLFSWLVGPILEPSGFVYVEDEHVVGNLSLRYALPGGSRGRLIGNVVVQSGYRGQGIARALMEMSISTAREQGVQWIGLDVREDNAIARSLYEHLGFVVVGQTQHLLRPQGIPWPSTSANPHAPWRASNPRDGAKWVNLARAIYNRRQCQVLEIRPNAFAFGGMGQRLDMWLNGQYERAWLYGHDSARMALRVRTERRHRFHTWDILMHPNMDQEGAQIIVNKAVQTVRRFPNWPVVTVVADCPALLDVLYTVGFKCHRTLVQMVLEL